MITAEYAFTAKLFTNFLEIWHGHTTVLEKRQTTLYHVDGHT